MQRKCCSCWSFHTESLRYAQAIWALDRQKPMILRFGFQAQKRTVKSLLVLILRTSKHDVQVLSIVLSLRASQSLFIRLTDLDLQLVVRLQLSLKITSKPTDQLLCRRCFVLTWAALKLLLQNKFQKKLKKGLHSDRKSTRL